RAALSAATSDVHHGAGEGPGDAVDVLHVLDDQRPELVDVGGLRPDDHVVGSGDVLGERHALDAGDCRGDVGCASDLGLDQDVGLHHHRIHPPLVDVHATLAPWGTSRYMIGG